MIHTKNTVPTYDQELRQKIDVIAIAPAAHVSKTDFGEAIHLESKRDPVPLFDKIIHYRSRGEWAPIKRLEPHPDAPWFDHFNDSPTFTEPVKAEIDFLIRNYSVFK